MQDAMDDDAMDTVEKIEDSRRNNPGSWFLEPTGSDLAVCLLDLSKTTLHKEDKAFHTLIRLSQLYLLENGQGKESETTALEALSSSLTSLVGQQNPDLEPLTGLINMQKGVWKVPQVNEVLRGKAEVFSPKYLLEEYQEVRERRLIHLIEGGFFDLALKYSKALVGAAMKERSLEQEEWMLTLQLHLALMTKMKLSSDIFNFLSAIPKKAFANVVNSISELSQNKQYKGALFEDKNVECLMRELLCSGCFIFPKSDDGDVLLEAIVRLALLNNPARKVFFDGLQYVVLPDTLYRVARMVGKLGGEKEFTESLRIYIQGITLHLNSLEVLRAKKSDDPKTKATEECLSAIYLELSKTMTVKSVQKELVLTAFSLNPTYELFDLVKSFASESDPTVEKPGEATAAGTENQPVPLKVDGDDEFLSYCDGLAKSLEGGFSKGHSMCRAKPTAPLIFGCLLPFSNGSKLPDESSADDKLNVPADVLEDLLIVICAPRWYLLSWLLEWKVLEEKCQTLVKTPNLRHAIKELQYVDIDYTQFDEMSSDDDLDESGELDDDQDDD